MADATRDRASRQGLCMTGLLASISSPAEARVALEACADIIDCKDPHDGALGALPPETISRIVQTVAGERRTSATAGNLVGAGRKLRDAIHRTADCGVDFVKFGLFSSESARAQIDAVRDLTPRHDLIAVCFADRYEPESLLGPLADGGVRGVMIDTADKRRGSLTELWGRDRTGRFVHMARELGLLCGLAGRLRITDIADLLPLGADYLGFRSALCGGDRRAGLNHASMMSVRDMIPFRAPVAPVQWPVLELH